MAIVDNASAVSAHVERLTERLVKNRVLSAGLRDRKIVFPGMSDSS